MYENEAEVTKALLDYAKSSKKLIVKGGFFGGKAFTSKQVEELSQLPPKDVLISMVIGLIASPISNLIGTVEALYADPIRVIVTPSRTRLQAWPGSRSCSPPWQRLQPQKPPYRKLP